MDSDVLNRVAPFFQRHLDDLAQVINDEFAAGAECCESPIEEVMLGRLMLVSCGYSSRRSARYNPVWIYSLTTPPPWGFPKLLDGEILIAPQAEVDAYRIDFVLFVSAGGQVGKWAIECDGHDFHERTKEQAARDKRRDRDLQAGGFQVFRYTGSEIWQNDDDLLAELERALFDFYERANGIGQPRRA